MKRGGSSRDTHAAFADVCQPSQRRRRRGPVSVGWSSQQWSFHLTHTCCRLQLQAPADASDTRTIVSPACCFSVASFPGCCCALTCVCESFIARLFTRPSWTPVHRSPLKRERRIAVINKLQWRRGCSDPPHQY